MKGGWSELFSRKKRKPLFLGVTLALTLSLTGINMVIFYAPTIFQLAGFGDNDKLVTIAVGGWNFISTVIAILLVDRLGRKPLLIFGVIVLDISAGLLGLSFLLFNGSTKGITAVISLLSFVFGFAIGPGATFWVLVNEISPKDVRDQANAFVNLLQWGVNLILAFVFQLMLSELGPTVCFWIFGGVGLVCLVILAIFLPEMKGKNINL